MVNYILLIRRQPYQAEERQMKNDVADGKDWGTV